jgi:ADP-ribosylglycohydrolase
MEPEALLERIYAGVLGKACGVLLGAPLEVAGCTDDYVREHYGEVTGYVHRYRQFAADDDTNGPLFFIRTLEDAEEEMTARDVGNAWLNYTSALRGMFWWGGYGVSTEHTAYCNLAAGIPAPKSGSIAKNGATVAEQIGGQIFIDSWGLVCPGNPRRAAQLAAMAASVSHDGEGLYGGIFMAAAIAAAFESDDIQVILHKALEELPACCGYRSLAEDLMAYYQEQPDDWRACFAYVKQHYGYDKYPGNCHMIPNAAVCILALLYGQGDYGRTICIAVMCGWDTDCNAGNVGTILGVAKGLAGIDAAWREPVNDVLIASSVLGSRNVVDIPTFSQYLLKLAYQLEEADVPEELMRGGWGRYLQCNWSLPGSTQGMRASGEVRIQPLETPGLEVCVGGQGQVYVKTFYRRRDFEDERYEPFFSPLCYPGERVSITLQVQEGELSAAAFARLTHSGQQPLGEQRVIKPGKRVTLTVKIPAGLDDSVELLGLQLSGVGRLTLLELKTQGMADYQVNPGREAVELGTVTPFTFQHARLLLQDGQLSMITAGGGAALSGHFGFGDLAVEANLQPEFGHSHLVALRVQGNLRAYYGGLDAGNQLAIYRQTVRGAELLTRMAYCWKPGESYALTFAAQGDRLTLALDGEVLLEAQDNLYESGGWGVVQLEGGHTRILNVKVKEGGKRA